MYAPGSGLLNALSRHPITLASFLLIATTTLISGCELSDNSATNQDQTQLQQAGLIRPVKLHRLEDSRYSAERLFPAQVRASKETDLSFRIPGQLVELKVLPGESVKKGQVLAQLDDTDLRNELALREANYRYAQKEQQRIQKLLNRKLVSQSQLDQSNNRLKTTRSLFNIAQQQLEHSVLRAPFNARIGRKLVENHQYIQPQQTILSLQASDSLDIRIEIPEKLLAQLGESGLNYHYQPSVYFEGQHSKAYSLNYKQHDTQAAAGTQSFEILYSLPTPQSSTIYPGMSATVKLNTLLLSGRKPEQDGFTIPLTAVLKSDHNGSHQVWRYNPDKQQVQPLAVNLGAVNENGVVVYGELAEGQLLVSAGLNKLKAGMRVKPLVYERGI